MEMVSAWSHKPRLGVRLPHPQPIIDSSTESDQRSKDDTEWVEPQSWCIVDASLATI